MYNAKLDQIYNAVKRKKNIDLPHEINDDGAKDNKMSTSVC